MKTIHITLAADKSLKQEQMELADLVENLNYSLSSRGTNILMVVWDCSSKHDEGTFREKVADTDLCLNLYYETFNDSSLSDLDAAFQSFCEGKNPKKIYVYFKDSDEIPENLREFRDSFPTRYGHFYCSFSNIDTLKADFLLQFIEYHANTLDGNRLVDINNGKITIDGKEYVNLRNVPFAGNNEEYNRLIRDIKKTRKLLAVTDMEDEDYMTYAKDLDDLLKTQQQMEKSLWETAMLITKLCTQQCSERLERAMELFQSGDNKGANALLDEDAIDHDVQQNKRMIQLGKEAHKALLININEYRLKIKATQSEMAPGWSDKVIALYEKTIDVAEGDIDENEFAELLEEYAFFLGDQRQFHLLEALYDRLLCIYESFLPVNQDYLVNVANCLNNKAWLHYETSDFSHAEKEGRKALAIYQQLSEFDPFAYLSHIASCLNNLANIHSCTNSYVEAEKEYKEALSIRRSLSEKASDAFLSHLSIALNNIANFHCSIKHFDEAEEEFEEALSIYNRILETNPDACLSGIATTMGNLANLHKIRGEYVEAEKEYKETLSIFSRLSDINPEAYLWNLGINLNNLANLHVTVNHFKKAENEYKDALFIFRKLSETNCSTYLLDVMGTLSNLADLHVKESMQDEAIEEYEEVFAIYRQSNTDCASFNIIETLNRLASLHAESNRHQEAAEEYKEVLLILRQSTESNSEESLFDIAECLNNLAEEHCEMGFYTDAEQEYKEAITIFLQLAETEPQTQLKNVAMIQKNLANLYRDTKRYLEAETEFSKSLSIFRQLQEYAPEEYLPQIAICNSNLAFLHSESKLYPLAETEYLASLSIFRQLAQTDPMPYYFYVEHTLQKIAHIYYLCGKYNVALEYVEESVSITRGIENLNILAHIYQALGRYEDALRTFEECLSEKINEGASQESIKETQDKITEVKTLIAENLNKM